MFISYLTLDENTIGQELRKLQNSKMATTPVVKTNKSNSTTAAITTTATAAMAALIITTTKTMTNMSTQTSSSDFYASSITTIRSRETNNNNNSNNNNSIGNNHNLNSKETEKSNNNNQENGSRQIADSNTTTTTTTTTTTSICITYCSSNSDGNSSSSSSSSNSNISSSSDSHSDIYNLDHLSLYMQDETDEDGLSSYEESSDIGDQKDQPKNHLQRRQNHHHHHHHRHHHHHHHGQHLHHHLYANPVESSDDNGNNTCDSVFSDCSRPPSPVPHSDSEIGRSIRTPSPSPATLYATNSNDLLTRQFRRSSIGMQRKSAFRQRKLDSLGAMRRQRRTGPSLGTRRPIRIVPDWTENAIQGEHYWKPTSVSGDLCCLNEECIKSGQRMKCSACQLIAHQNCIPYVNEKTQLACKPTYRDVGVRQYREQSVTHHHWVHRKMEKGKCKQCGKAVQGKLFGSKEIVALSCAWCHEVYHNKESCFNQSKIGEECKMGNYAPIIVPPSWIVKLPTKGNFKSSIRVNNKGQPNAKDKKTRAASKRGKKDEKKEQRAFIVKPIPSTEVIPVIVYINPKSGGNQGVKLLGKFQHILNPRQVFDLTQGGPKFGLELFRKAPNLRILACGGDGTVGWVLSVLDQLNPPIQPPPAVGVLPLGTGNDLARALGWGGGYTDEPIGKILKEIGMSQCVLMDRWRLKVSPNEDVPDDNVDKSKDNVPLNVINNYFSFGVDAHIALEFHEAREAHPERFNSRLRNKMYYGQMGGKDLILRQYRNLSQWVTLECDGQDYTAKLKDAGCHAVLFLNIPSYGGGTHPWNDSFGQSKPAIDDGLIEVVGLTTYQLPMLQAGLHGTCICQCRTARITTRKTIPMQVDGEACRVKPSIIEMELLNKAIMLAKRKSRHPADVQVNPLEVLHLTVLRITMDQYEKYHYEKDMLRKLANKLGKMEIESQCDLEHVRNILTQKFEESIQYPKVSQDWCFIDSCTAEHYFRIDRAQEHLHYICDIAVDELYILDHEAATMPQTPDQERSFAAYSQRQAQNDRRQMDQQGTATVTCTT